MNEIKVESLEQFIHEIDARTKTMDLYKEIIDRVVNDEIDVHDKDVFKVFFLLNEFNKINSCFLSEKKSASEEHEHFDNFLDITGKIANILLDEQSLSYLAERHKTKINRFIEALNKETALANFKFPLEFYYRGEAGASWKTTPSVLRNDYFWSRESFFFHEIQVRCPKDFDNLTFLGKLVTMQHYGCPTRLLDITSNPLNALYFACESKDDLDGKVVFFPIIQGTMAYGDADRALILSCIPHLNYFEQKMLLKEVLENSKNKLYDGKESLQFLNKLLLEIRTEKPSFEPRIEFGDLLNPLFVQPNMTNPRIANQQGAFLLSGLSETHDDIIKKIKYRMADTQIVIPKEKKRDILRQLNSIGINKGTIYPNMEQVAEYLKSL
jgi:hypothetical protein